MTFEPQLPVASSCTGAYGLSSSLQELYREAILGSLIKRGFLSRKLDLLVS